MYNDKRHLAISEHVVAVLMCNDDLYWQFHKYNLSPEYFLGEAKNLLLHVHGLRLQEKPVHVATLPASFTQYASQLINLYDTMPSIKNAFSANCEELRRLGQIAIDVKLLQKAIYDLTNGTQPHESTTGAIVSQLTLGTSSGLERETASELAQDFMDSITSAIPQTVLRFYHNVLDSTFPEGILPSKFLAIAAPDKGRKTTFMLNWFIRAMRNGHSASIFMIEDTRSNIVAGIVAMLATEWLIKNGFSNAITRSGKPLNTISAQFLQANRHRIGQLGDKRDEAIRVAIEEFHSWQKRGRIYDKTKQGGALSDIDSVLNIAMRDKMLYGSEVIFVDHLQSIEARGSDYEKQLIIVDKLESFVRSQEIGIYTLAQLNGTAAEGGNWNTHSMGITGGNKIQQKIDLGFTLFIEGDDIPENTLRVKRHIARGMRSGMYCDVQFHPESGWFYD